MSLSSILARGRAAQNARMVDHFLIKVPNGFAMVGGVEVQTYDETKTLPTIGYIANTANAVRRADAGDRTVATATRELRIPWDSPAVHANAVAICDEIGADTDPTLLGATLKLDGPAPGSQMTARRLQVSEVLS